MRATFSSSLICIFELEKFLSFFFLKWWMPFLTQLQLDLSLLSGLRQCCFDCKANM